jgi:hypothetical protein
MGGLFGSFENITDRLQSLTVYCGFCGFQGVWSLWKVSSSSSLDILLTRVMKTCGSVGRLSGNDAIASESRTISLTNDLSENGMSSIIIVSLRPSSSVLFLSMASYSFTKRHIQSTKVKY